MTTNVEACLSDAFLDRVRRAYRRALDAGARPRGRIWRKIDARRRSVHEALLAEGNNALRAIFADPVATDLFFGTDNLCRSIVGSSNGRPFLELALESARATYARHQLEQLQAALASINGTSVVEIGPGVGHCAFFAHRAGIDYTTIDLPLGLVAQACFLGHAAGPENIWLDGDPEAGARNQIKLLSAARLPDGRFDVALNVDSMTEMSLAAALDYVAWINSHARLFVSMNHEINAFTISDVAERCLAGRRLERRRVPERGLYYFQETFRIEQKPGKKHRGLVWLRVKTSLWSIAVRIRRRLPFVGRRYVSASFGATQSPSCS
jgi:hypothetical protein